MKRLLSLSSILLVLILFVTSCGKQPTHINVIPVDAFGVMLVKPGNFDQDEMAKQIESNDEYKNALEEIREESEILADIFEEFINDPSSIGIDMENEMYIFAAPNEEDMIFGMVMAMKNATTFEDIFKKMMEEMEMEVEIEEIDGFKKIEFPMGVAIWDNNKILILGSDCREFDVTTRAKELMNQKASDAIMTDKDFSEFYENSLGLNFWISSNVDNMQKEIGMAETFLGIDLNNNFAHLHFGWDKDSGEFTMIFKMRFNESISNMDPQEIIDLMEETDMANSIQNMLGSRSSYEDESMDWEEWEDTDIEEISEEDLEELYKELEEALDEELEDE